MTDPNGLYTPLDNNTDKAPAAVGGLQVSAPLDATAITKFCTKKCTISSTLVIVIVFALAFVAALLTSAIGGDAGRVVGVLLGALLPGLVVMIWFSEAIGGTSVDRCQIATVWFTMFGVMALWLIGPSDLWNALLGKIFAVDGNVILGNPHAMPRGDLCCQWFNRTLHPPMNATYDPYRQDFCFCPATGMAYGLGGGLPEELLK